MTAESPVMKKVRKARSGLVLDNPFFGILSIQLKLKEDPTCGTAWVDGKTLGFSPEWVKDMPLSKIKGFLAHEVMHVALMHHLRRGERKPQKWNIAGDFVINAHLHAAGFDLPETECMNPSMAQHSTEHVYNMLPDNPGPGGGGGGNENSSGDDPGDGSDPGGCGEVRDGNEVKDAAELRQAENEIRAAVSQAQKAAKMQGKMPEEIERLIGEVLDPKVDWRELLRRYVMKAAKNDYTWMRPNRRFIHQGLYLPSLYSETMGDVVIAVDTSGSIGQEELDQFGAEMTAILRECRPEKIHVVYCDASVSSTQSFTPDDLPLRLKPKGGGGTDFRPPFKWVDKQGLMPQVFVYLTDMYCNSFPDPPPYDTIWVSTTDKGDNAPFGMVINM